MQRGREVRGRDAYCLSAPRWWAYLWFTDPRDGIERLVAVARRAESADAFVALVTAEWIAALGPGGAPDIIGKGTLSVWQGGAL